MGDERTPLVQSEQNIYQSNYDRISENESVIFFTPSSAYFGNVQLNFVYWNWILFKIYLMVIFLRFTARSNGGHCKWWWCTNSITPFTTVHRNTSWYNWNRNWKFCFFFLLKKINLIHVFSFLATTGALAAGVVLGWSSPAELKVVNANDYHFPVNSEQWSWVGSTPTLGGFVSCLLIGFVMDAIGRKITMLGLIIPFTIGWAMIIWPSSVVLLYIGRFVVGFAGGAFFVVGFNHLFIPFYTIIFSCLVFLGRTRIHW